MAFALKLKDGPLRREFLNYHDSFLVLQSGILSKSRTASYDHILRVDRSFDPSDLLLPPLGFTSLANDGATTLVITTNRLYSRGSNRRGNFTQTQMEMISSWTLHFPSHQELRDWTIAIGSECRKNYTQLNLFPRGSNFQLDNSNFIKKLDTWLWSIILDRAAIDTVIFRAILSSDESPERKLSVHIMNRVLEWISRLTNADELDTVHAAVVAAWFELAYQNPFIRALLTTFEPDSTLLVGYIERFWFSGFQKLQKLQSSTAVDSSSSQQPTEAAEKVRMLKCSGLLKLANWLDDSTLVNKEFWPYLSFFKVLRHPSFPFGAESNDGDTDSFLPGLIIENELKFISDFYGNFGGPGVLTWDMLLTSCFKPNPYLEYYFLNKVCARYESHPSKAQVNKALEVLHLIPKSHLAKPFSDLYREAAHFGKVIMRCKFCLLWIECMTSDVSANDLFTMSDFYDKAWRSMMELDNEHILNLFAPSRFDDSLASICDVLVANYTAQCVKEDRSEHIDCLGIIYGNAETLTGNAEKYRYGEVNKATCLFLAGRLLLWLKQLVEVDEMMTAGPIVYAALVSASVKSVLFRSIVMKFLPDKKFAKVLAARAQGHSNATNRTIFQMYEDLWGIMADEKLLDFYSKFFRIIDHPRFFGKHSWREESEWIALHSYDMDDCKRSLSLDQYYNLSPHYLILLYIATLPLREAERVVRTHLLADSQFPLENTFLAERHFELLLFGKQPNGQFVSASHFKRLIYAIRAIEFWELINKPPVSELAIEIDFPVALCSYIGDGIKTLIECEWAADEVSRFVWRFFSTADPVQDDDVVGKFRIMTKRILEWSLAAFKCSTSIATTDNITTTTITTTTTTTTANSNNNSSSVISMTPMAALEGAVELLMLCWKCSDVRLLIACTKPSSPTVTPPPVLRLCNCWQTHQSALLRLLKQSLFFFDYLNNPHGYFHYVDKRFNVSLPLSSLPAGNNQEEFTVVSWLIAHNCFLAQLSQLKLSSDANQYFSNEKFLTLIAFVCEFCKVLVTQKYSISRTSREEILNAHLLWIYSVNPTTNFDASRTIEPRNSSVLWQTISRLLLEIPDFDSKLESLDLLFPTIKTKHSMLSVVIVVYLIDGLLEELSDKVILNLAEALHSVLPVVIMWSDKLRSSVDSSAKPIVARLLLACLRSKSFLCIIDSFTPAIDAVNNLCVYDLERGINNAVEQYPFIEDILENHLRLLSSPSRSPSSAELSAQRSLCPQFTMNSDDFECLIQDPKYFLSILMKNVFFRDALRLEALALQIPVNDLFKPMLKKGSGDRKYESSCLALVLSEVNFQVLVTVCLEQQVDTVCLLNLIESVQSCQKYTSFGIISELLEKLLFVIDNQEGKISVRGRPKALAYLKNLTGTVVGVIHPIVNSGLLEVSPLWQLLRTLLAWEGVLHSTYFGEVDPLKLGSFYDSPSSHLVAVMAQVAELCSKTNLSTQLARECSAEQVFAVNAASHSTYKKAVLEHAVVGLYYWGLYLPHCRNELVSFLHKTYGPIIRPFFQLLRPIASSDSFLFTLRRLTFAYHQWPTSGNFADAFDHFSLFYDTDHLEQPEVSTLYQGDIGKYGWKWQSISEDSSKQRLQFIIVASYLHDLKDLIEQANEVFSLLFADALLSDCFFKLTDWIISFHILPDCAENKPTKRLEYQKCCEYAGITLKTIMQCAKYAAIAIKLVSSEGNQLNGARLLERLFVHTIKHKVPSHWLESFETSTNVAFFVKYVEKEDLGKAYEAFEDANKKEKSANLLLYHLDKVRELLVVPIVTSHDLISITQAQSTNGKVSKKFCQKLVQQADECAQPDVKFLLRLTAAWMIVSEDYMKFPLPPRNAQLITFLLCSSWIGDVFVRGDFSQGKALIAQVGTGEGKSLIIAMMAIYCIKVLGKHVKRVHVLENNLSLLEKDLRDMTPLYEKFDIKRKVIGNADSVEPCLSGTKASVFDANQQSLVENEFAEFGVTYCLRQNMERYYQIMIMKGKSAPFEQTVLICDEVDDLIVDGNPNNPYTCLDKESHAFTDTLNGKHDYSSSHVLTYELGSTAIMRAQKMTQVARGGVPTGNPDGEYMVNEDKTIDLVVQGYPLRGVYDYRLEYWKLKKFGIPPTYMTNYYIQCTPYMLEQYSCILGFSGSLGSLRELTYLQDQFKAWTFKCPPFLNTCRDAQRREPILLIDDVRGPHATSCIYVHPNTRMHHDHICQVAIRMCKEVPVLIISSNEHEVESLYQLIRERSRENDLHDAVQTFLERDPITKNLCSNTWADTVRKATNRIEGGSAFRITLTDKFGGRGHDFKVNDDDVDDRGGLLVIVATLPPTLREWTQWLGRTCRRDNKGQYIMILNREKEVFCSMLSNHAQLAIEKDDTQTFYDPTKFMKEFTQFLERKSDEVFETLVNDIKRGKSLNQLCDVFYSFIRTPKFSMANWPDGPAQKHLRDVLNTVTPADDDVSKAFNKLRLSHLQKSNDIYSAPNLDLPRGERKAIADSEADAVIENVADNEDDEIFSSMKANDYDSGTKRKVSGGWGNQRLPTSKRIHQADSTTPPILALNSFDGNADPPLTIFSPRLSAEHHHDISFIAREWSDKDDTYSTSGQDEAEFKRFSVNGIASSSRGSAPASTAEPKPAHKESRIAEKISRARNFEKEKSNKDISGIPNLKAVEERDSILEGNSSPSMNGFAEEKSISANGNSNIDRDEIIASDSISSSTFNIPSVQFRVKNIIFCDHSVRILCPEDKIETAVVASVNALCLTRRITISGDAEQLSCADLDHLLRDIFPQLSSSDNIFTWNGATWGKLTGVRCFEPQSVTNLWRTLRDLEVALLRYDSSYYTVTAFFKIAYKLVVDPGVAANAEIVWMSLSDAMRVPSPESQLYLDSDFRAYDPRFSLDDEVDYPSEPAASVPTLATRENEEAENSTENTVVPASDTNGSGIKLGVQLANFGSSTIKPISLGTMISIATNLGNKVAPNLSTFKLGDSVSTTGEKTGKNKSCLPKVEVNKYVSVAGKVLSHKEGSLVSLLHVDAIYTKDAGLGFTLTLTIRAVDESAKFNPNSYGKKWLQIAATPEEKEFFDCEVNFVPADDVRPPERLSLVDAKSNTKISATGDIEVSILQDDGGRARLSSWKYDGRNNEISLPKSIPKKSCVQLKITLNGYYIYEKLYFMPEDGDFITGVKPLNIAPADMVGGECRVVLTWKSIPRDLDLTCIYSLPEREGTRTINYSNKNADGIRDKSKGMIGLDCDKMQGNGPETITFTPQIGGRYCFFVHNFSGDVPIYTSEARIEIVRSNGECQTIQIPTQPLEGKFWHVMDWHCDGRQDHVVTVNEVKISRPTLS